MGSVKNYVTDEKGQIKVPVQKLVPKTYVAKIKFKGNSHYIESETADVVVVKKATPKIGAKAKTLKIKKKKGKATFKITKLTKKGKFNAAITYKGNKYYKKVTKKTKIIIK